MDYPKTYEAFTQAVLERFGVTTHFYKYKAGHIMATLQMEGKPLCDTDIHGPTAGHSHGLAFWAVNIFGWAYLLLPDMTWVLVHDGSIGWRQGPNPFPEIPEIPETDLDYWDIRDGRTTHLKEESK